MLDRDWGRLDFEEMLVSGLTAGGEDFLSLEE